MDKVTIILNVLVAAIIVQVLINWVTSLKIKAIEDNYRDKVRDQRKHNTIIHTAINRIGARIDQISITQETLKTWTKYQPIAETQGKYHLGSRPDREAKGQ